METEKLARRVVEFVMVDLVGGKGGVKRELDV